jgi:hypothetical protein
MPIRKLKKIGAMRLIEDENPVAVINLLVFLNKLYPSTDIFNDLLKPRLKCYIARKCFEFAKAGDEMTTALWIEQGYLRLYKKSVDKKGAFIDETVDFVAPQQILLAPECFFKNKKCSYHIDISKGAVVVLFTRSSYEELKADRPEIKSLAKVVLAAGIIDGNEKRDMMRLNAADRYDRFIELYGEAINRFCKQKDFASLLGISDVYLSRLRTKRNGTKSSSIALIAQIFYYWCEI